MDRLDSIDAAFTSRYWELLFVHESERPTTLVQALISKLPHIDSSSWGKRLQWGGIFVNGQEVREEAALPFPCRIEYYEPKFNFEDPHSFYPRWDPNWIVFEDENLICVFKPNKLPSMPAREQIHFCLKAYVEAHLGHTVHMPSRLDMSTFGLVIMSKTPDTHNKLQRVFETRRIKKFYLLETAAEVPFANLDVDSPIGKDPVHPVLRKPVTEDGKPARTVFTKLCSNGGATFVRAEPLTGRTHQIRVHASYNGFPIIGDKFYGGADSDELHLMSYKLSLTHPVTTKNIEIQAPTALMPGWARACEGLN